IYGNLPYQNLIKLMGRSLIYIGNSSSDGTPNTLLEAIIMGAFPIQSNPGEATEELITHKFNGLLIEEPQDYENIAELLKEALNNSELRREAIAWNFQNIKPELERELVKQKVLK